MKFPDKIKLFYKEYKINYKDEVLYLDSEVVFGKINFDRKEIEISVVGKTDSEILEILLHELNHAVINEMRISAILNNENEEDIVCALTTGWTDIILRNEL